MSLSHARRHPKAIALLVASLSVYLLADLGTKQWALENLATERAERPPLCAPDERGRINYQYVPLPARPLWEGFIDLHYAENCGAAFSMLGTAPGWVRALVFGGLGVVEIAVLLVMFFRGAGRRPFELAVPLILSGAIGNLSDRVRHGFVVDFIQVDPDLFHYPTMNVADIWIAIGFGLLLVDGVRGPKHEASKAAAEQAA